MSLEQFFDESDAPAKTPWGSAEEQEIRLRIKLCVAAYAYEIDNNSIMSDSEFDGKCRQVNLNIKTGNRKLDNWFKKHFDPSTGQWIHTHPEKYKIKYVYETWYKEKE
jgi:predicted small secreted protein